VFGVRHIDNGSLQCFKNKRSPSLTASATVTAPSPPVAAPTFVPAGEQGQAPAELTGAAQH
jgi:hypothetical protein